MKWKGLGRGGDSEQAFLQRKVLHPAGESVGGQCCVPGSGRPCSAAAWVLRPGDTVAGSGVASRLPQVASVENVCVCKEGCVKGVHGQAQLR